MMALRHSGRGAGRTNAGTVGTLERGWVFLMALLLLIVPASPRVAASGPAHTAVLNWLRVDPLRPRVVYAGGYSGLVTDPFPQGDPGCGDRVARSSDGGTTWHLLPLFTGFPFRGGDPNFNFIGCQSAVPFVLAPDGTDLFYVDQELAHTADSGTHWARPLRPLVPQDAQKWQEGAFSIGGVDPRRAYAAVRVLLPNEGDIVARSDDSGSHWRVIATAVTPVDGTGLNGVGFVDETLPDPLARDVVYMGLGDPDPTPPIRWVRSDDGGRTWHWLRLPVSSGPDPGTDTSFTDFPGLLVSVDPRLPGALILRAVHVAGVPPDRRWVSRDRGATWKQALCPGDLHGECPAYTLDSVFGAGKAYGIYADGVHAFAGTGLAGPRLSLSSRLPCRGADVLDATGGGRAGDPTYLLCQASKEQRLNLAVALPPESDTRRVGTLYRSADMGASWRKLDPTAGW